MKSDSDNLKAAGQFFELTLWNVSQKVQKQNGRVGGKVGIFN